jgi:hypothetical protein
MEHIFHLTDRSGQKHGYTCAPHGGAEGFPLTIQIAGLVVEPLIAGMGPMFVSAFEQIEPDKTKRGVIATVLDNPEVLKALDPEKLGRGLKTALTGLSEPMVYAVLKYTNRDGVALIGSDGRPTAAYNKAYARNYMELMYALWEVADHNGFFPELATFADAAKKAAEAAPEQPESTG